VPPLDDTHDDTKRSITHDTTTTEAKLGDTSTSSSSIAATTTPSSGPSHAPYTHPTMIATDAQCETLIAALMNRLTSPVLMQASKPPPPQQPTPSTSTPAAAATTTVPTAAAAASSSLYGVAFLPPNGINILPVRTAGRVTGLQVVISILLQILDDSR
jgi:hypothetical protein